MPHGAHSQTEVAERPADAPDSGEAPQREAPSLDAPELYTNRELSWLDFNDRVLQLAEDPEQKLVTFTADATRQRRIADLIADRDS